MLHRVLRKGIDPYWPASATDKVASCTLVRQSHRLYVNNLDLDHVYLMVDFLCSLSSFQLTCVFSCQKIPSIVPTMLLLLATVGFAGATCYLANGTADSAPYIAQCPSSFGSQMCCWLVNLPNPDDCTTKGICLSNYNSDDSRTYVDGCTDPDWGSGCSPLGKLCRTLCHFLFTLIYSP